MPTPERQEVAATALNSAEGKAKWTTETQNQLRDAIGERTREDLRTLGEKLPMRVVKPGDTLDAIVWGLKKGGGLPANFDPKAEVEYRTAAGATTQIAPNDTIWSKLLAPGQHVFLENGGLVVQEVTNAKKQVPVPKPKPAPADKPPETSAEEPAFTDMELKTIAGLADQIDGLNSALATYLSLKKVDQPQELAILLRTKALAEVIQEQPQAVQNELLDGRALQKDGRTLRQVMQDIPSKLTQKK